MSESTAAAKPAKSANSNLAVRFATALVGGPIILALLYLGPPWGWLCFVAAATAVGAWELFGMTHPEDDVSRAAATVITVALTLGIWFCTGSAVQLLTLFLVVPLVGMVITLVRLGDMKTAAMRTMALAFGPLYVGGGMAALAMLRRDGGEDGASFVVLALLLSWLSDTGGYFAGRFLGKHKLYPAVSPKKTVEGSLGGVAGGVVGALLAHFLFLRSLPLGHALALGVVGSALGQVGDLGESLLKRSFGVKDSGGIVPGHGGILDRVDALLVTGTICYLYVLWAR
ncbi:MAG: phosphatidate cytidylyltransferase [Polyangiaceae bacterium]